MSTAERIRLACAFLAIAASITAADIAGAQESAAASGREVVEAIETDRDSFTPATTVVGPRAFVLESAYSFIDNRRTLDTHSFPETLIRYGIGEVFELRFGGNYEVGGAGNTISGSVGAIEDEDVVRLERESQISYGFKTLLTEQRGFVPRTAFIAQGLTPTSGPDPATQLTLTYAYGWQLPNRWQWDSSLRYATDAAEGDHYGLWAPSSVLKIPLTERWNAHVEYFGIYSDGRRSESTLHYFSPGSHFLLTPNCEVGARVGWGLNEQAAAFFANFGVGLRF